MRFIPTVLLFVLALPALAQTPDTTSAWRYFPLAVGNVWEFKDFETVCYPSGDCEGPMHTGSVRWRITEEVEFDGHRYFAMHDDMADPVGATGGYYLRFDTLSAHLVTREGPLPWWALSCAFDADFGGSAHCSAGSYSVSGGYGELVEVEGQQVETTRKVFRREEVTGGTSVFVFGADLGFVYERYRLWEAYPAYTEWERRLTYARVGDMEYGTSSFPVTTENAPESAAASLTVFPNPSRGDAAVRFSLDRPQRVTLAVYDVLGRRVLARDLGAQPVGEVTHRLDMASLPAGVYVVRLDGDAGATATARVVRH